MINVKKYEGQMSIEEFTAGLLDCLECKTLGCIWEQRVVCQNCAYREACTELSDAMMTEHNVHLYCRQVIDILLGDLKIETLIDGGQE